MGILRNTGERPYQPVLLSKDLLHTGTFAGYYCTVLSASILYYCSVEGAPEPMDTSEPVVLLRVNSRKISNTSRHSYIEAVCMWEGGGRASSLVPRPYPLTRRNGLVNQVEFLTTVLLYQRSKHVMPYPLKKGTDTQVASFPGSCVGEEEREPGTHC